MRTNVAEVNTARTYEGGPARIPKAPEQLVRQVATCMLFEDTFYEKGSEIARQIDATASEVAVEDVAAMALVAREQFKLRHVPLFLLAHIDKRRSEFVHDNGVGLLQVAIEKVIQRPDEMAELLSIIQKVNPGKPLKKIISAQVKKGLARAFRKFSEYQLAKWNRDASIKLRDVLFLCHAKPKGKEQTATWKRLVNGTLDPPDTWEVALSGGADKREAFERLLTEKKLGYIALLMNLRNMAEAGVDRGLVESALVSGAKDSRALPFRFVSAAKHAPSYAQALSDAMLRAIESEEKLRGTTLLLVDVSGSMDAPLSSKGTLNRWEAASALAILLREIGESVRVFTFSNMLAEVSNFRGLSMLAGITNSQPHGGTMLAESLRKLYTVVPKFDRIIVVTDEQSQDGIANPADAKAYLVNVAAYRPALDVSGRWTRISGFSERIVDFIRWEETERA